MQAGRRFYLDFSGSRLGEMPTGLWHLLVFDQVICGPESEISYFAVTERYHGSLREVLPMAAEYDVYLVLGDDDIMADESSDDEVMSVVTSYDIENYFDLTITTAEIEVVEVHRMIDDGCPNVD